MSHCGCKDKHKCKDKCNNTGVKNVKTSKLAAKRVRVGKIHTKTIKANKISAKRDICNRRVITRKDFLDCETLTLSKTFVIEEEGNYVLGENIEFEPILSGQNVIQILTDNVCLDLCCNFIKQINNTGDVTGIHIGEVSSSTAFFKNISIKNGSLLNITGQGIGARNIAFFSDPIRVFENICIEDMNILECGSDTGVFDASGINLDGLLLTSKRIAFRNIIIRRCKINNCVGNGVINITTGDGTVIEDCQGNDLFGSVGGTFGEVYGLNYFGRNLQVTDCQFNNVTGGTAQNPVSDVAAFNNFFFGENFYLSNCQFNNCNGFAIEVGSFTDGVINMQVENCQFNNTSGLLTSGGGQVAGLFSQDGTGHYFLNCEFNNTFGENYAIIQGVNNSTDNDTIYENCQFNNTRGGTNARFIICGVHGSDRTSESDPGIGQKFINCQFNNVSVADDNEDTNLVLYGIVFGTWRDLTFEGCEAVNIGSNVVAGVRTASGFFVGSSLQSVVPEVGNVRNLIFRNCVARDIVAINGAAAGLSILSLAETPIVPALGFGENRNFSVINCIAENISGITTFTQGFVSRQTAGIIVGYSYQAIALPNARQMNVLIRDCRVSDVKTAPNAPVGTLPAPGIVVESVKKPVICNNSVSCCEVGIWLTGTDDIIPNAFQVALTEQDALADPPVVIDIGNPVGVEVTLNPDPMGLNPIPAFYTERGPQLVAPLVDTGVLTDPDNACSPLINGGAVSGNMGVVQRDGACNSSTFVFNVQNAGATSCLILSNINNADNFGGFGGQTIPAVAVNASDGSAAIAQSIMDNPGTQVTLTPIFSLQTFDNVNQGNTINVSSINFGFNFIEPVQNLTPLGWQTGDEIEYNCNGQPAIPGLVCDETYYAVVYSPGFSCNGLIQENKVDNCSVSGYQDDKEPTGSSWVNNVALLNGPTPAHNENYDINWQGVPQVDEGTLAQYPLNPNKYYNLSLI